jgi:thiamine-monophosphate kinase
LNEFELIRRFFNRPPADGTVRLGVGDDAAVVTPTPGHELLLAIDTMVEGRHFFADVPPATLGHKILAVNLSDMAAMGAAPRWALLSGALPDNDPDWLAAFSGGLFALAKRYDVSLVGGDTVRGTRSFTLAIAGEAPAGEALTRAGAQPNDDLWVPGTLGGAARALAAMQHQITLDPATLTVLRARLEMPEPRVALGLKLRSLSIAHAALDISDGLIGDLGHILKASGVGAEIELSRLPCHPALKALLNGAERPLALHCLLAGGDDYELCFATPPDARDTLIALSHELALPLTRIGVITATPGLAVLDEQHRPLPTLPTAYDHFEQRPSPGLRPPSPACGRGVGGEGGAVGWDETKWNPSLRLLTRRREDAKKKPPPLQEPAPEVILIGGEGWGGDGVQGSAKTLGLRCASSQPTTRPACRGGNLPPEHSLRGAQP